ncbi:putative ABC transporter permease [Wukongibacter sp. M2B1]|uniref:putative ABC transporter permease n=1 Tax=Wukongibacter sp. M2B1 TaxID=3088895 RepID=UPI003D7B919B
MNKVIKHLALFFIMGIIYYSIEVLWRGYSHIAMFFVGGLCGVLIGNINEYFTWETPLFKQQFIATIVILVIEFISGCILNIWLRLGIWDYSQMPFNLYGQICLVYAILWYFLSLVCIVIDDILRWKLFGEEKPRYRLL